MNAAPLRSRLLLAAVLLVSVFRPPSAAAATPARDAIEVKFAEGAPVRLREGRLTSSNEGDPGGVEAALLRHPVLAGERLFSQPEEEVARERGTLVAPAGGDLPDLNRWYRLTLAPGTDVEALLDALKALPEVERAYPAPLPAPPPGAVSRGARGGERSLLAESPTPSYLALQGYERAATTGIDAGFAWAKAGGNGSRATIVDVEYSFNPGHEDLPTIPVIGGVLYGGYGDDHGTAVLGELAGTNNGSGVLGVAHGARILFSAACGDSACSAYTPADAINNARLATAPGDVILIEQQTRVCNSGYGPLEWIASVYDAVVVATAARRTVVEAAGNGGVDLDQPGCAGAFDRAVRDSGAIIVGAGAPPGHTQRDRSRLGFSSYGSRVDAQGWGAAVATTGYGDLYPGTGADQRYTDSFSGTSSASPIVAGAAALLSSISRQRGTVQTPARIRAILAATGSPQQATSTSPVSQNIGPRPDLRAAIIALERPVPLAPGGAVSDATPTYRWRRVPGATRYLIELIQGGALLYTRTVSSAVCAGGACSTTPAAVLEPGAYAWRARAYLGAWKAWSARKGFSVGP